MIECGFFNSLNGDRLYNAQNFNTFFQGLISDNGVFEDVNGGFVVTSGERLSINVASGKAIVNTYWVTNDAVKNIELEPAHNLFARYDAVVLRLNGTNREVTLELMTGIASSEPIKPTPTRTNNIYEIILAYIYIAPNVLNITNAVIQDVRYDTNLCGIITGLIKQVDTSTLYNQYAAQFQELVNQIAEWQKSQKEQFNEWLETLTKQLNINTYITKKQANYITTEETNIIAVPDTLNYEAGDILELYSNGVLLVDMLDYEFDDNAIKLFNTIDADNTITFICLKSKIGWN